MRPLARFPRTRRKGCCGLVCRTRSVSPQHKKIAVLPIRNLLLHAHTQASRIAARPELRAPSPLRSFFGLNTQLRHFSFQLITLIHQVQIFVRPALYVPLAPGTYWSTRPTVPARGLPCSAAGASDKKSDRALPPSSPMHRRSLLRRPTT